MHRDMFTTVTVADNNASRETVNRHKRLTETPRDKHF